MSNYANTATCMTKEIHKKLIKIPKNGVMQNACYI